MQAYLEYFYGFFIHALWPNQLRPLFWLSRPQQNLQPFLNIVHEILSGIRVIQKVLPYDKLEGFSKRHRGLWSESMARDAICG
jgi:hypothetical protein